MYTVEKYIYAVHTVYIYIYIYIHSFIHSFIYSFISIQPFRPVLAGTRTQSGNRYGSGTLHPGQVLRDRLPLLFPAFRRGDYTSNDPRDL